MEDPLSLEAISGFIRHLVHTSLRNRLHRIDNSPIFEEPLLGVADGDDPLFQSYKRIIGDFHLTPREVLAKAGGHSIQDTPPEARVLCWVLPISHATRKSNAEMTSEPSERWIHTYFYGEAFNDELRTEVERYIQRHGATAVAPAISPVFKSLTDASGRPSSTWSERHALFAAGLGTFGLCDGFITPAGKAMRCGSVITDVPLPVTQREYATHTSNCPFLSRGTCGACIKRCPAGAISSDGHDKVLCKQYQDETLRPLRKKHGVTITGCGLCQTAVPCESARPS